VRRGALEAASDSDEFAVRVRPASACRNKLRRDKPEKCRVSGELAKSSWKLAPSKPEGAAPEEEKEERGLDGGTVGGVKKYSLECIFLLHGVAEIVFCKE
jgi:hypothetical protein